MSERKEGLIIRRILVAMDSSSHSLAALAAAADFAAKMEAELFGLFVEDIELIRLAEFPFAREIRYTSAVEEPLDSQKMERALKVQAAQCRQALAAAAGRSNLRWSFRVARGIVSREVLAAAAEADLLSLGRTGSSLGRESQLGSTALAVATNAPTALLLIRHGLPLTPPAVAIYDGSESAQRALNVARQVTKTDGNRLTVFLLANGPEMARRLEEEVATLIEGYEMQVSYRRLSGTDVPNLARAVSREGVGVLVIGSGGPLLTEEVIRRLLSEVNNPILIVR